MRSLVAVALVAAAASTASAEPYLGLGIGTAASGHVGDDASSQMSDGNRSGKFLVGYSFGKLSIGTVSVEGSATRFNQLYRNAANDGTSLAIAGKYGVPLGDGFEAFGRLGLQRSSLSTSVGDLSGNGWLLSAGFEYHVDALVKGASVFVDYTHNQTTYDNGPHSPSLDSSASMWMLGASMTL
jgi:hypothetical protein